MSFLTATTGAAWAIFVMAILQCTSRLGVAGMSSHFFQDSAQENETANRIATLMATAGDCRITDMLQHFSSAAPGLGRWTRRLFADAIEHHENFDEPNSLSVEITSEGTLKLQHGGPQDMWVHNVEPFKRLPEDEQKKVMQAIEEEIQKQKPLVDIRRKFQNAAEKHLSQCLKPSFRELQSLLLQIPSKKAKQAQLKDADLLLFECFWSMFEELEGEGVNVEELLLGCWKPVVLLETVGWCINFKRWEEQLANETFDDHSTFDECKFKGWQATYFSLHMYDGYVRMKDMGKTRSDF